MRNGVPPLAVSCMQPTAKSAWGHKDVPRSTGPGKAARGDKDAWTWSRRVPCLCRSGHPRGRAKVLEDTCLSCLNFSCGKGFQLSGVKITGAICTGHICPGIQSLLLRGFSSKKLVPRLTRNETPIMCASTLLKEVVLRAWNEPPPSAG